MATAERVLGEDNPLTAPLLPAGTLAELDTRTRLTRISYPESAWEPVQVSCDYPGCPSVYRAEDPKAPVSEVRDYAVTLAGWSYTWPQGGELPPLLWCRQRHVYRPSAFMPDPLNTEQPPPVSVPGSEQH